MGPDYTAKVGDIFLYESGMNEYRQVRIGTVTRVNINGPYGPCTAFTLDGSATEVITSLGLDPSFRGFKDNT